MNLNTDTWLSIWVLFPLNGEVSQGESTHTILKQMKSLDKTSPFKGSTVGTRFQHYLCLDPGGWREGGPLSGLSAHRERVSLPAHRFRGRPCWCQRPAVGQPRRKLNTRRQEEEIKDLRKDLKDTDKEKSPWSLSLASVTRQSLRLELWLGSLCLLPLPVILCCSKYPSAADPRPRAHQAPNPHRTAHAEAHAPLSAAPYIPPKHGGRRRQAETVRAPVHRRESWGSILQISPAGCWALPEWPRCCGINLKPPMSWAAGSERGLLLRKVIIYTMA